MGETHQQALKDVLMRHKGDDAIPLSAVQNFNNTRHDYEITLEPSSIVEVCADEEAVIPKIQYHVRPLCCTLARIRGLMPMLQISFAAFRIVSAFPFTPRPSWLSYSIKQRRTYHSTASGGIRET